MAPYRMTSFRFQREITRRCEGSNLLQKFTVMITVMIGVQMPKPS